MQYERNEYIIPVKIRVRHHAKQSILICLLPVCCNEGMNNTLEFMRLNSGRGEDDGR